MKLPVIHVVVEKSDYVAELERVIQEQKDEISMLQRDYENMEYVYRCEVLVSTELLDLLRENGIPYRPSIDNRPGIDRVKREGGKSHVREDEEEGQGS